jgi:hypothetical protein
VRLGGGFKASGDRQVTVKSRVACKLVAISYVHLHEVLHKELAHQPAYILSHLGQQLACGLLTTSRKYCDLAFMDVDGWLARALLCLTIEPTLHFLLRRHPITHNTPGNQPYCKLLKRNCRSHPERNERQAVNFRSR